MPSTENPPPRREGKQPSPEFADDVPNLQDFVRTYGELVGMDSGDVQLARGFRGPGGAINKVLEQLGRLADKIRPPPVPQPDPELLRSFVRVELQKHTSVIIQKFGLLLKRVESLVDSSVRNESHYLKLEKTFRDLESSLKEAVNNGKDALSLELKALFEAQLKELKAMHQKGMPGKKSGVQKFDDILKDFEIADTFPRRIKKLAESTLYRLAKLMLLYKVLDQKLQNQDPEQPKQAQMPTEMKKLEQLAIKLEEVPVMCETIQLEKGKFSDIPRTSEGLLHQFFPGDDDESVYQFSYAADATSGLAGLILGDGGPLSFNCHDVASFHLKLKSTSTKGVNAVGSVLAIPQFYHNGVRGSIAFPLPATFVKGKVHYLHEYGGVLGCIQMGANPLLKLSCVFGVRAFSLGADAAYNPVDKLITKNDLGFRYSARGFDVALLTKNFLDTVCGSVCYNWGVNSVGVEDRFTISTGVHKLFFGGSRMVDSATVLKARIGLESRASAQAEQNQPKGKDRDAIGGIALLRRFGSCCMAGLSCEVDLHFTEKPTDPRFGLFFHFGAPKKAAV